MNNWTFLEWVCFMAYNVAGFIAFSTWCTSAAFQRVHVLFNLGLLILAGPFSWAMGVLFAIAAMLDRKPQEPTLAVDPLGKPADTLPLDQALTQILAEHVTPGSGTYLSDRAYQIGLKALQAHETKTNKTNI